MGAIKFPNWRARHVIVNVDGFVDIAQPEDDQLWWKDVLIYFLILTLSFSL
jgi:hypothetical protein